MNTEKLILLVQQHDEIYNLKNANYSNQLRRNDIWEQIGKTMRQPGDRCRERWVRVRDNFRKALKLRKTKIGQYATNMKPPKYEKELSFLLPHFSDGTEAQISNVPAPTSYDEDIQSENNAAESDCSDSTNCSHSVPTSRNAKVGYSRKRPRLSHPETPTVATVFQEYLKSKANETTKTADDPISHFFLSMAKTVKTFPYSEQVEIKRKVFNIVHDVESRLASKSSVTSL